MKRGLRGTGGEGDGVTGRTKGKEEEGDWERRGRGGQERLGGVGE